MTLDDLEPLREYVQSLPEGERDHAADLIGERVASFLLSKFLSGDDTFRKIFATTDADEPPGRGPNE